MTSDVLEPKEVRKRAVTLTFKVKSSVISNSRAW